MTADNFTIFSYVQKLHCFEIRIFLHVKICAQISLDRMNDRGMAKNLILLRVLINLLLETSELD